MEIQTDPRFWDCECSDHYIHSRNHTVCNKCGAQSKDQSDSRVEELRYNNFAIGCCALNIMTQLKQATLIAFSNESPGANLSQDELFEQLVQPISDEEQEATYEYHRQLYDEQTKAMRAHRISRILYVIYNAFGETGAKVESDGEEKVLLTFKDDTAMSIHIDYAE